MLEGYLREAGDDVAGALNLFIDRELQECEEEASFSRAASEASRVSRANSSESVADFGSKPFTVAGSYSSSPSSRCASTTPRPRRSGINRGGQPSTCPCRT